MAKPVIGTRVPAPAYLAMLSYRLSPVSSADKNTRVTETVVEASYCAIPKDIYQLSSSCPKVQIAPPIKKAKRQFFPVGELGDACFTSRAYCFSVM